MQKYLLIRKVGYPEAQSALSLAVTLMRVLRPFSLVTWPQEVVDNIFFMYAAVGAGGKLATGGGPGGSPLFMSALGNFSKVGVER